jgi:adenylate cyclase
VRIAAQLVDAASGQTVWAQNYDRVLTDVFATQDEISEAIAASLVADLNRAENALLTRSTRVPLDNAHAQHRAAGNFEAWGLYQ